MKATPVIVLMVIAAGSGTATESSERGGRDARVQEVVDRILDEPLAETSPESVRMANYLMTEAYRNGIGVDSYAYLQKLLVQHTLGLAERQRDLASEYKSAAVAMTYNLAANTWAGWGPDEAAAVEEVHARLGLEAARANVRLAAELGLGPERRKNGYWMLGAQLIAAGELEAAIEAFATSRYFADEAGDDVSATMAQGWVHLSHVLAGRDETPQLLGLQEVLRTQGQDGAFYADQYDAALAVFSSVGPGVDEG